MFHAIKKNFAKARAPSKGINPGGEFLDFQARLSMIKNNLQYIDDKMEESLKLWNEQMIEQRGFAEKFANGYPIRGDETDDAVREFAHGSHMVYEHFLRGPGAGHDAHRNMRRQVREYIEEINEVELTYTQLEFATSETERYQEKIDKMDRKGQKEGPKWSRNLEKLDHSKLMLESEARVVVAAQKKCYSKAPMLYKAALCAYWTVHIAYQDLIAEKMEKTTQFVKHAGEDLGWLAAAQLQEMFEDVSEPEQIEEENLGNNMADHEVTGPVSVTYSENGEENGRVFTMVPTTMPMSPKIIRMAGRPGEDQTTNVPAIAIAA